MNRKIRGMLLVSGLLIALVIGLGWAGVQVTTAQGVSYGANWTGQYFNSTNFTNPQGTGAYPNGLNFNFTGVPNNGAGVAVTGVGEDNFSARLTSTQTFQAGSYTFTLVVDDQVTVFIAGSQVFNATVPGTYQFVVPISTAGNYNIQVDWVELTQTAILQFYWTTGAAGVPGTTPGAPGFPAGPTATPAPIGPQASVMSVRGLSLRSGPYLGASLVAVLRPNIAYTVLARNGDEGGTFTWYFLQAGERVGWASGRYLSITGDVNLLPFVPTDFESIDGAPDTGVIGVPRAFMNLRRRPSTRAASLGQIPWGEQVSIIGRTVQGGQSHWLQVRWNNLVGWIDADFVSVRGDINLVPVR